MAQVYNGKTYREVCWRAARLGREQGWCRQAFRNRQGAMCLLGLLNTALEADFGGDLPQQLVLELHEDLMVLSLSYQVQVGLERGLLKRSWEPSQSSLMNWNDFTERTADEVLGCLEAIAAGAVSTDTSFMRPLREVMAGRVIEEEDASTRAWRESQAISDEQLVIA